MKRIVILTITILLCYFSTSCNSIKGAARDISWLTNEIDKSIVLEDAPQQEQ